MRVYVWRPNNYGASTYWVMAESQEVALALVLKYRIEVEHSQKADGSFQWPKFPETFDLEIYEPGQVGTNSND